MTEGLDLSECDEATKYFKENEFLSQRVDDIETDIWITRDKESGEIIVRTKRAYIKDAEWEIVDKTLEWVEDLLECPRWSN